MFINSISMQVNALVKRKNAVTVYFAMLILVLINYFGNVVRYRGSDVMTMVHPMKLVLLSDYSALGFFFMQYFPFVVIIPAAFSFFSDKDSKEITYIRSRVGARNYYYGKLIAVFIVTFFVFTIPLLIDVAINCIAFPMNATGDPSNLRSYDLTYIEGVWKYLFSDLYVFNSYLYTIAMTLLFGGICGVLATFCLATSMFSFMKYKIIAFLPVYALLYVLQIAVKSVEQIRFTSNYFEYLRFYTAYPKSEAAYILTAIVLLLICVLLVEIKSRKDTLE